MSNPILTFVTETARSRHVLAVIVALDYPADTLIDAHVRGAHPAYAQTPSDVAQVAGLWTVRLTHPLESVAAGPVDDAPGVTASAFLAPKDTTMTVRATDEQVETWVRDVAAVGAAVDVARVVGGNYAVYYATKPARWLAPSPLRDRFIREAPAGRPRVIHRDVR